MLSDLKPCKWHQNRLHIVEKGMLVQICSNAKIGWSTINNINPLCSFVIRGMYLALEPKNLFTCNIWASVLGGLQTTQAQTSLRIRAD